MTVFIAHAEADRAAAEALEKYLERRGLFVELEDGARGFRHVQRADTVVALLSKNTVFSPYRLLFEKRTMEAWADEQLVLVKLDHAFAPVGLRDLPAIDASFEAQRDIAWAAVTKSAQTSHTRSAPAAEAAAPSPGAPAPQGPAPQRKGNSGALWRWMVFAVLVLLVAGLSVAAWLYRDALLRLTPDQYQSWMPAAGAGAALVLLALVFVLVRPGKRAGAAKARGSEVTPDQLFVSYAHADNTAVLPVVEAVQAQGRSVWLDKGGIAPGEGWAGEIVRAIKAARGVIVMCSTHAFESDHVKREVYLADRYKKPMLPVFIEAAAPPEDFEYFFAGVQWLELHKTPEADRAAAIARAIAAV
jgi:hypothetical protein